MLRKKKVLVIDDDEHVLATIESILAGARYDVTLAATCADGLAQLLCHRFDLALCDFSMPEKADIEMVRSLKAIDPTLPIVVMIGDLQDVAAAQEIQTTWCGTLFGRRVIQKPFPGSELIALIYACLVHRSAQIN